MAPSPASIAIASTKKVVSQRCASRPRCTMQRCTAAPRGAPLRSTSAPQHLDDERVPFPSRRDGTRFLFYIAIRPRGVVRGSHFLVGPI